MSDHPAEVECHFWKDVFLLIYIKQHWENLSRPNSIIPIYV